MENAGKLLPTLVIVVAMSSGVAGCGSNDSAADGATGGELDAAVMPVPGKRVFITRQTFTGALAFNGVGAAGADDSCAEAARAAALAGSFKAWVSTSSVDAIDRISGAGPWFDLAGKKIFEDRGDLMGSPVAALWLDEHGASLSSDRIWTGTDPGGVFSTLDGACNDWSSASMSARARIGQVGRGDGAAWTAYSATGCDQQAHLTCFEQ